MDYISGLLKDGIGKMDFGLRHRRQHNTEIAKHTAQLLKLIPTTWRRCMTTAPGPIMAASSGHVGLGHTDDADARAACLFIAPEDPARLREIEPPTRSLSPFAKASTRTRFGDVPGSRRFSPTSTASEARWRRSMRDRVGGVGGRKTHDGFGSSPDSP
jgi:hypothetical protein